MERWTPNKWRTFSRNSLFSKVVKQTDDQSMFGKKYWLSDVRTYGQWVIEWDQVQEKSVFKHSSSPYDQSRKKYTLARKSPFIDLLEFLPVI